MKKGCYRILRIKSKRIVIDATNDLYHVNKNVFGGVRLWKLLQHSFELLQTKKKERAFDIRKARTIFKFKYQIIFKYRQQKHFKALPS